MTVTPAKAGVQASEAMLAVTVPSVSLEYYDVPILPGREWEERVKHPTKREGRGDHPPPLP
jgi:hypothetical protein